MLIKQNSLKFILGNFLNALRNTWNEDLDEIINLDQKNPEHKFIAKSINRNLER